MSRQGRIWFTTGCLAGLAAVMLGAFGAHALRGRLDAPSLALWQTAVSWHMPHAIALLGLGLAEQHATRTALLGWAARLMIAGLLVFCGSLYALALTGERWLGMLTPLGGTAWIAAWLLAAVAMWPAGRNG